MPFFAEALAAINAGLKAIELWEQYGPVTTSGVQTLNLVYDPAEFDNVAKQVELSLQGEYDELFKGTKDRVAKCIKSLNEAAGADDDVFAGPEKEIWEGRA